MRDIALGAAGGVAADGDGTVGNATLGGSRYDDERMDRLERMVYGLAGSMGIFLRGRVGAI